MWLYGEGRPTACSSTASDIQCFLHDQYLSNLNEDRQIVIPVESEMVPAIRFESEMV
uniref:Uncharacterized protein n=1 Tax=Oryza nivara TaxID=4536 RepID=A0A0E0HWK5_ORYNI